ncbi:MAG: AAA family ATPase [Bacteroidota bacterium]
MKTLEYTLLCQKVSGKQVLGQLLETGEQLVSKDVKKLRAAWNSYLDRQLKKNAIAEPDVQKYQLEIIQLNLRPRYVEEGKIFPVKETLQVKIYGLYGINEFGYYEGLLPALNKRFYFYQERDFEKMAIYFAQQAFFSLSPSASYQLLISTEYWLETISVRIPPPKKQAYRGERREYKMLSGLTDSLPQPKIKGSTGLPPTWERGQIVDQLVTILNRERGHVILVGKGGVGKSSILHEVVRKMTRIQKKSSEEEKHTFWRTTPSRLTSKARYLGDWEEMLERMIAEAERANGIIWIENLVMLAKKGGEGAEDSLAAFLIPFIRQKSCLFMGELRPTELEAMRRMLPGFVAHFRLIQVEEMDQALTLKVLSHYHTYAERQRGVEYSTDALDLSYVLTDRFLKGDRFPGKLIRFLQFCTQEANSQKLDAIGTDLVIRQFSQQSGLPEELLRDDILLNGEDLRDFFLQRIKGQDKVIDAVCSLIKVFKAGLNDPDKPVATMIFAGPTGVGKTATARAISEYFFRLGQSHQPLIRLDMSEFQHAGQVSRLIGAEGKLTSHIRLHPFSVVLLDEIEKANPLIFSTLLTMLDEGILMDDLGRITDFRNSIIIMTSNLGSTRRNSLGFLNEQSKDYDAEIRGFFAPEFYNRIDRILTFQPLQEESIRLIARRELAMISDRAGLAQRDIEFDFTEALVSFMAEKGFDERYGARPLQREIERLVVAPLSRLILANPEMKGEIILVDFREGKVQFELS